MSQTETIKPYVEREAECYVCKQTSPHLFLKDRVYIVEHREEDYFISKYKWIRPEFYHYDIHYFYFWHCVHCKFTEERSVFFKSNENRLGKNKDLFKAYQEIFQEDKVIQHLSKYITYPYSDYLSVLSIHLLAVYIQKIPPPSKRNLEKIARYLNRTSWIFGLEKSKNGDNENQIYYNEFTRKYEILQTNFMNTLASLEDLYQWLQQQILVEKKQKIMGWQNQEMEINENYSQVTSYMDDLLLLLQKFNKVGTKYHKSITNDYDHPTNEKYHEYNSYLHFLLHIKDYWAEIPINEQIAVQRAIDAYLEIIRANILEDKKFKLFQVYRFIIYLYQKLEDFDQALKYSDVLLKEATNFRIAAKKRLSRLDKIKDDRVSVSQIKDFINKTNDAISNAAYRKEKIYEKKIEIDFDKAKKIYMDNRSLSPEQLKEKFIDSNLCEEVIVQFMEEKHRESKKGIFQLFR